MDGEDYHLIQQNNAAGLKQHGIHCSGAISSPPFNCCLHQQHHHHPLIHMPSSMIAFLLLLIASSSFLLVTSSLESDEIDVGPLNPQPDDNDTQPPESNIVVEDAIIDSPTTTTTTTTTNTTTITTTTPPTTTAIVAAEAAVGNIPHVSLSNSGDEDIESLKRVIDQTNDRLIHLLAEQERIASSLEEARADMVSMRAQVQEKLSQMDRFMQNEARQNISSTTLPGQTDPMCMVTEWSGWSPCSASCGNGIKIRTRHYINPATEGMCDIDLTEKSYCLGDGSECNPRSNISVAGSDHVWEGNATDARGEQGLPVDSAASPRDSYQREMDHKFEILSHRLEQLVNNLKAENGNQILLNNRIIVISLAVVSVPISCLLILILYLTLRRDKKIVKSEHRLALNEMNHLRRYNDY